MKELKEGQVVKVYQKPVTKEDYEGKAKLIKKLKGEIWEVQFRPEEASVIRKIKS